MSHLWDFALWKKKKKGRPSGRRTVPNPKDTSASADIQQFGLINKINSALADFKPEAGLTGLYTGFTTAQFTLVWSTVIALLKK